MNVLFVYTVSNCLAPPKKPLADWFEISLALSYLAAVLEREGHTVSLIVLRHGSFNKDLERKLADFDPALVCFTAVATEFPFVQKVAEAVRQRMLDVDHSNPGGQGQSILARLCDETTPESNPTLLEHKTEEAEPKPKRRRRTSRRTSDPQPEGSGEVRDE